MKTLFVKLDRIAAWVLFVCVIIYFVSGFGMTKGIIDSSLATTLHLGFLNYIMIAAFVFHSAYAIRLSLMRNKLWGDWGKVLWAAFYALFIIAFVYVENAYSKLYSNDSSDTNTSGADQPLNNFSANGVSETSSTNTAVAATATASGNTSQTKTFTLDELSKYDGENGMPAYVAVDGKVYDLSNVFRQGSHYSHYAGKELTTAFYSYHVRNSLSKYPVVGQLSD